MDNVKLTGPVTLSVPANADMMLIVRLTVAGVVARAGLTLDQMDSLKIAAEEACSCLISQTNPPKALHLRFECADSALCMNVTAQDDGQIGEADQSEMEIIEYILASLADEVAINVRDGWIQSVELRAKLA